MSRTGLGREGAGAGRKRLYATAPAVLAVMGLAWPVAAHADAGDAVQERPGGALEWKQCAQVAEGWDQGDKVTECAMLEVPVDYAKPNGRKTRIAVSRIKASDPSKRLGVLLINPGGPGSEGLGEPRDVRASELRGLGEQFDLIGFDIRGTGYSDKPGCPELSPDSLVMPTPPPGVTDKEKQKLRTGAYGKALATCSMKDQDFSKSLTTPNSTKDMDWIRQALGEKKISYFGKSWGTALGASYRSQFDGHVDRMVLDSVLTSWNAVDSRETQTQADEKNYQRFTAWMAERADRLHLGATADDVSKKLLALRADLEAKSRGQVTAEEFNLYLQSRSDEWASAAQAMSDIAVGKTPASPSGSSAGLAQGNTADPGFGKPMGDGDYDYVARSFNCNGSLGGRDFDAAWDEGLKDQQRYPVAAYGMASVQAQCTGYPFPGKHEKLTKGKSPLQLFAHASETNTPLPWAQQMKQSVGGKMSIIKDDIHVSMQQLKVPAKDVVDFFSGRTGPFERTYEGKTVPELK